MDEPKLAISPHDPSGPIGADAAPVTGDRRLAISNQEIAASNCDHVESPADPLRETSRENSHVVYCGTEEELSEGLAIALRIMGLKQSQ